MPNDESEGLHSSNSLRRKWVVVKRCALQGMETGFLQQLVMRSVSNLYSCSVDTSWYMVSIVTSYRSITTIFIK